MTFLDKTGCGFTGTTLKSLSQVIRSLTLPTPTPFITLSLFVLFTSFVLNRLPRMQEYLFDMNDMYSYPESSRRNSNSGREQLVHHVASDSPTLT